MCLRIINKIKKESFVWWRGKTPDFNTSPIERLTEMMIYQAIKEGASMIRLIKEGKDWQTLSAIEYCKGGLFIEAMTPPYHIYQPIVDMLAKKIGADGIMVLYEDKVARLNFHKVDDDIAYVYLSDSDHNPLLFNDIPSVYEPMREVLVVVDYQKDFASPDGKLYVPKGETIAKNIQELIDNEDFSDIIYTFDTHTADVYGQSKEAEIFPNIHCEIGTDGWELFNIKPRITGNYLDYVPHFQMHQNVFIQEANNYAREKEMFFTKDKFDIFDGNKNYERILKKYYPVDNTVFVLCGLATNYCVYDHYKGLRRLGYRTMVVKDAVCGIPDDTYKDRLKEIGNDLTHKSMFFLGYKHTFKQSADKSKGKGKRVK